MNSPTELDSIDDQERLDGEAIAFFETNIRPVLVRECYGCHSDAAGNVRGGLRLDTRTRTLIGGTDGPAVVPGDPESSLLYLAINHEGYVMPPDGKLADDEILDFQKWIEMGAPDPRDDGVKIEARPLSPEVIAEAKREHWAYQPHNHAIAPEPTRSDWAWTDTDRFILEKLESAGLDPASDASPEVILRRLTFDLIGLPPTPAQVKSFVAACRRDRPKAIAQAASKLMESPEFGRRWGRHWMDVVRYAESTGSAVNMTYPHAWRYRDFIIESFNADKPFDHFLRQQIAGDLLPAKDDQAWAENLIATAFLAIGPKTVNESNSTQFRADVIDEQIDAVGQVFLAQSIACARCHDHKFDPIGQTDYYAMAGLFQSTQTYFGTPPSTIGSFSPPQIRQTSSLMLLPGSETDPAAPKYSRQEIDSFHRQAEQLTDEMAQLRRSGNASQALQQRIRLLNGLSDLSAKLGVLDSSGKSQAYTMGVQDRDSPTNSPFLQRGEIDERGPAVPRGIPMAFRCDDSEPNPQQSGRLELAQQLSSPDHPLTARVYVNRVWAHLFGRGIVDSPDNFGTTGDSPSHPDLLDHLASEFIAQGWSTKRLIHRLVTSRIYQTSSDFDAKAEQVDPNNELLWRRSPTRLDAESVRDSMLAVSGLLDTSTPVGSKVASVGYTRVRGEFLGDPRTRIQQAMNVKSSATSGNRAQSFRIARQVREELENELDAPHENVRSVYLPMVRDAAPRSLQVFDMADANRVLGQRETSHTAEQALFMMNNPLVHRVSRAMADRICAAYRQPSARIDAGFALALSRKPNAGEKAASLRFTTEMAADPRIDPWTVFCQSLLASAEFRIVD